MESVKFAHAGHPTVHVCPALEVQVQDPFLSFIF